MYYLAKLDEASKRTYRTACDTRVKDEGEKSVFGFVPGSNTATGAKFRVGNITKCPMSVADMNDKGMRVVFDQDDRGNDISHAPHKATGEKVLFSRKGKIFNFEIDVLPHAEALAASRARTRGKSGPGRQAKRL